jgi:periodic tryptophan protein 1
VNSQVFQEITGGASTSHEMDDDNDENESDSDEERVEPKDEANGNGDDVIPPENQDDEFNFKNYDKEQAESVLKITDVVEVADEDQLADEDNDSEAEDDIIKPTDNLVLVGRVEADCSSLEVYLFNEEENSLYVHHDFLLPFHILCVEWFSFDAGSDKPGNLCAIGGMEPIIHIYDLDIHQPLEPVVMLGQKASKKKKTKRIGHKDAVLDLAWNSNYQHILASASVDQTVILWDIENATPSTVLKDFAEKVQTIEFNASEPEYLLTGCSDNTVKLFDCRQSSNENAQYKQWIVEGEVEKVKWNPNEKYHFVVGTNSGKIMYFDSRTTEPLWSVEAHEKEVTDFAFNSQVPGVLTSSSVDNYLKVWKFDESSCNLAHNHHCKVGKVHSLNECPENNWIIGIGGDKRRKNFNVINLTDFDDVKNVFVNGHPIRSSDTQMEEDDDDKDD